MSAPLLDVNTLVALAWPNHLAHRAAAEWFLTTGRREGWATTPITESGFVRVSSNRRALPTATSPQIAASLLTQLCTHGTHEFWADDLRYVADDTLLGALRGHRQVTDAHLLALARAHKSHLVTFDGALAALGGSDVELLTA